jgi:hypothetical protein
MSVGYLWQTVEKILVVLVVSSRRAEVEDLFAYVRDIELTKYNYGHPLMPRHG